MALVEEVMILITAEGDMASIEATPITEAIEMDITAADTIGVAIPIPIIAIE